MTMTMTVVFVVDVLFWWRRDHFIPYLLRKKERIK